MKLDNWLLIINRFTLENKEKTNQILMIFMLRHLKIDLLLKKDTKEFDLIVLLVISDHLTNRINL